MGKRKGKIIQKAEKPDLIASLSSLSIEEIDRLQKAAPMAFQSKLQAALNSNDAGEIMKANLYLGEINRQPTKIQSVFFDPNDISGNGRGFKDSKGVLSFSVLRRMGDIHIVKSIVSTRVEQIMNFMDFSEDEQKEGFTIRKKKSLFSTGDEKLTNEDKKKISKIVDFLEKGGWTDKWDNVDSLQEFVSKIMSDSLTLDQLAFEMVRNRMWELQKFRAVDASLIRFLDSVDPRQREGFEQYRFKGHLPRYCMVWDEMILHNPITKEPILYYPWELGFGIRNKTSDVRRNGYGVSELETLVNIITWILWGFSYNANFFCVSPETLVTTNKGLRRIKDLVGTEFEVFDGVEYCKASAYKTRIDDLYETRLYNGLKIRTSREHRFLIITDKDKSPKWKEQKDLTTDDYCLVDINTYGDFHEEDYFIGREYFREFTNPTKEAVLKKEKTFTPSLEMVKDKYFWEMIGFALGDGTWLEHILEIFPHHTKDKKLFGDFSKVLDKYGINYRIKKGNPSTQRSDGEYGYPYIFIYDTCFIDWLISIGFGYTRDKKIPISIFNLPEELRCAFLRGLFSADGHTSANIMGYKTPTICCVNNDLRQDILQLLLSVGVAARECNRSKSRYNDPVTLVIQDVMSFVDKIGYLQDYKNEGISRGERTKDKWDLVPNSLALDILENNRGGRISFSKHHVKNGGRISRGKLIRVLTEAGCNVPEILNYHFYKVTDNSRLVKEKEQLYDIEVFNDKHIFLANYTAVHNCQGSQPKGFINIKNPNISNSTLQEFRQAWTQTMAGVSNSHRTPVINGIDLEWVDLQKLSNRDMEFNEWIKFLIIMTCSVYRIDPSELGFNFKESQQIFGQDGQRERLKHSREKGLKPLLIFLQGIITKYIVSELDENYEFAFTGIEVEDEEAQVKLDSEKLSSGMVSMQDIFKKYNGRDFDPDKDIILNQVYQGMKQAEEQNKMFGASQPGQQPEGVPEGDEEDPFAQYKSFNDNPIIKPAVDYYLKNLYK